MAVSLGTIITLIKKSAGNLSNLTTENKDSLVDAINEVNDTIGILNEQLEARLNGE